MVLGRQFVDLARRCGVGHVEAGLGIAAGRPDAGEGAAAAIGHPHARILTVPVRGGVEFCILLVGVGAAAVVQAGAMAALDAHVVHQRVFTGTPQQRHRAVVDLAGREANAGHDAFAAARALEQRLGTVDALELGRAVRQQELGQARVQGDDHGVRPHADGVVDDIEAQRQVDHAVAVDRLLDRRRVVGLAVAFRAVGVHIGPLLRRRQRAQGADGRLQGRRQGRRLVVGRERPRFAHLLDEQAIVEFADGVVAALAGQCLAAVAKADERRHVARDGIFHADLGIDIVFVADDERGLADVLEAHVLAPQPVAITAVDLDADRGVLDFRVDHREAGLMLADRGVALALERRIHQRELPCRRCLFAQDAVAAAVEAQVVGHVADLVDAGQARPKMEIDVAQVRVLGRVHAHRGGGRVAVLDLEVDVGQRRVEGRGVGVSDRLAFLGAERYRARYRHRYLADAVLVAAGEDDHIGHALLVPRRVLGQHEHGPGRADAIQAHGQRDQQRARDAIASRRQEHDAALALVGGRIQRLLDRGRVVGLAVAFRAHHDGARVFGHGLVGGDGCGVRGAGQQERQRERAR